jgi:hypothetical protein
MILRFFPEIEKQKHAKRDWKTYRTYGTQDISQFHKIITSKKKSGNFLPRSKSVQRLPGVICLHWISP